MDVNRDAPAELWSASGPNRVIFGDNLGVLPRLPDEAFQVIAIDPPFNTGREQTRFATRARRSASGDGAEHGAEHGGAASAEAAAPAGADAAGADAAEAVAAGADAAEAEPTARGRLGFHGQRYDLVRERVTAFDDQFADYWSFLEPRLEEAWRLLHPTGTLYVHLDYREVHYAKVLLDALFGRECFLNEIIWVYDYGGRTNKRWPSKHDTILVYVKDPRRYHFDNAEVDREPYMAPGLVTPEKAARGKLPTDVWWHTIVTTNGREKTGYPTQKPLGIVRRMIAASSRPGDWVLDFFAGSGTLGEAAARAGRRFVLVDSHPEAIATMRRRLGSLAEAAPIVFQDAAGTPLAHAD